MVKTPLMRQMEIRECGAVALGIILAYYGKYLTLAELRAACGITREGVTVTGIVRAAKHYGLIPRVLKRQHLNGVKLPFVIYWNFNHFLVVEAVTPRGIQVNDPAYGRAHLSNALIQRYFSGIVLTFEPGETFTPAGHPPRTLPPHFFQPYTLVEIGRALIDIALIDALIRQTFNPLLALLIVLYVPLRMWSLNSIDHRYDARSFFYHMLALPFTFFSRYYVDDLAARQLHTSSMGTQLQALQPFIYGGRVVLYLLALLLIATAFLPVAVLLAAVNWSTGLYGVAREKQAEAAHHIFRDRLTQIAFNGIYNIEAIKLQGSESLYLSQLRQAQVAAYNEPFAIWRIALALLPIINLITLILFAAALAEAGILSLPTAIAGFCLALLMIQPAISAGQAVYQVREFKHQVDKISDIRNVPVEEAPPVSTDEGILLENVAFGYGDTPVLEGISLQVAPGQTIGVVGRSGSGKSTLVNLIAGLYPPGQGIIRVPRTRLALVDGQPVVLDATIAENISLFDKQISPDAIEKAAQDAGLHDMIVRQSRSYQQVINARQHPFSKGQLQCLEIARALVRKPHLLLLDEATSAMDAMTEAQILQNIALRGCTTCIVSHRLSAIRDCHEIVVVDRGKMVERGTHQSLMEHGQVYPGLIAGGIIK